MKAYKFDLLLQNDGYLKNQIVRVNDQGFIESIADDSSTDEPFEIVKGYCLPEFQYAMASLAEIHPDSSKSDDF